LIESARGEVLRIKITMQSLSRRASLPLDNRPFASLIYNLIGVADPEAAAFLHNEGVHVAPDNRKRFKPFVFSRLQQVGKRVRDGRQWLADGPVEWQVGSPIDELTMMMMAGLSANPVIFVGDREGGAELEALSIRVIEPPQFHSPMRFKTISPLFAAVPDMNESGRPGKHHVRPEDPRFAECVANNLREKFFALTGEDPGDDELLLKFVGAPKSQMVQYGGTNHKCCEGIFDVAGSDRLLRLGWECGFGEANSKGFGMVWAVR
jgi:CRISPR-associated endoribonuclease Cas6